jgi:transcriptional regulator with XRE-family HTH domain
MLQSSHEIPFQNRMFQPLQRFSMDKCFCRKRPYHRERRCPSGPVEGGKTQEPSQGRDGGCSGREQRRGFGCPDAHAEPEKPRAGSCGFCGQESISFQHDDQAFPGRPASSLRKARPLRPVLGKRLRPSKEMAISKMFTHKELKAHALERVDVKAAYDQLDEKVAFLDEFLKACASAGITQAEIAERIGTTQSAIALLESGSGKHSPSLATLQKYAHALGCRLELRPVNEMKTRKAKGRARRSRGDEKSCAPVRFTLPTRPVSEPPAPRSPKRR